MSVSRVVIELQKYMMYEMSLSMTLVVDSPVTDESEVHEMYRKLSEHCV